MQLSLIRQKFAELSGRHDLVVDYSGADYDDNGANFFLDNGQRYLERKYQHIKRFAWFKEDIAIGTFLLNFRYCYAIKEVWVKASGTDRTKLDKKDYEWIRKQLGEKYTNVPVGVPTYYAERVMNLGPDQIDLTQANYTAEFTMDAEEIMFADTDHTLYKGILFMAPADTTYTMSILGKFQVPILAGAADTLTTYWTEHHPDTLILAALYSLEGFYRNREGQRDYQVQIVETLNDIDQDAAEEDAQDVDSMEG